MLNPDFPFDPQEALDEACEDEYRWRINTQWSVYIPESITESDDDKTVGMLLNTLIYRPENEKYDAELGRLFRKLVKAYTYPNTAWVADKMADIMADLADESDYRLENNR